MQINFDEHQVLSRTLCKSNIQNFANMKNWIHYTDANNTKTNNKSPNYISHRRCSVRKGVVRNFAKFAGKHLCQSLFFNKVVKKKRLWHKCFPVNFVKHLFYRTPLDDCFWKERKFQRCTGWSGIDLMQINYGEYQTLPQTICTRILKVLRT